MIFMGKEDIIRQKVNVQKMKLLGANIKEVTRGSRTLKEAVDEAFEYLIKNNDAFYLIGSAVGPAPYPEMVKEFQKIIGEEAKSQILSSPTFPKEHISYALFASTATKSSVSVRRSAARPILLTAPFTISFSAKGKI